MNLRAYILIFIILLASGQYFTGRTDHLPRVELKGYLAFVNSDNRTERSWMEDPSYECPLDLKEQECLTFILHLQGIPSRPGMEDGTIHASQLDPLLLDRPPPIQTSPSCIITAA
jgi:hypothetical protein